MTLAAFAIALRAIQVTYAGWHTAAYFSEGGSAASDVGLGEVGRRATQSLTAGYEILWASIVCASILGVALLVSITGLERHFLKWHASQRQVQH